MAVLCPDWPVVAGLDEAGAALGLPAVVLEHGLVVASNEAARELKVRRGMRRRDAQARCPELVLLDAGPARDARAFEPALAVLEEVRPGVVLLRPGLAALRAPGRFYGGEREAAAVAAERLVEAGFWDCRLGVADDLFTAEQAARQAGRQESLVVPEGGSAAFLRDLPVEVLDDLDTVDLLCRLGIRTLGALAGLPARDVAARFGAYGARVHRCARGEDAGLLGVRVPPPEILCEVRFEPPVESAETVAFSVRRAVERLVEQLGSRNLVCTQVRIEAESEGVVTSARSWAHTRWLRAQDLVDRVRWQLSAVPRGVGGPVTTLRLVPEVVEPEAAYADGLWGGAVDDRVDRGVARVQSLLGYDAVVVPVLQGGRSPRERQALVPWGERPRSGVGGLRPREQPWPGSIPGPAPARVMAEPWPAAVVDEAGRVAEVSERGALSGEPTRFRPCAEEPWQLVAAWAGPWPVDRLCAVEEPRRLVCRFQIVGADGRAWLMTLAGGQWWTEALYE